MANLGAIRAGRAFVELFVDNTRLTAGLKLAQQQVESLGHKFTDFGSTLFGAGIGMGLPFAHLLNTYMQFDDVMRQVQGVTQSTGEEFEKLTNRARELGRQTSFTASEVGKGMLELGRAGFKQPDIDASIDDVMNLARATGTDLATAADIATNALWAFGLSAEDTTHVADVLVATANNSAQNLGDIGEALKYVAPIADEVGLSLDDVCKVIGQLANVGIKGSTAGTSIRKILTNMADPSIRAQYEALGVSVTDAAGNMRNMSDILRDLGEKTKNLPNADKLALFKDLFDMRALPSGAKLTEEAFQSLIDAIDNADGVAQKTSDLMDSGIGGAFRRLKSTIESVELTIGEELDHPVQNAVMKFKSVCDVIDEMIKQHTIAAWTILKVVGGMILAGAALIGLGIAAKLAAGAISLVAFGLKAVLAVALAPFKLIAVGMKMIATVASTVVMAVLHVGGALVSAFATVLSGIVGAVLSTVTFIAGAFVSVFGSLIMAVGSLVVSIGAAVIAAIPPVVGAIAAVLGTALGTALLAVGVIAGVTLVTALVSSFGAIVAGISSVLAGAFNAVLSFLGQAWAGIQSFFSSVVGFFTTFAGAVAETFSSAFDKVGEWVEWLKERFSALGEWASGVFKLIADAIANGNIKAAAEMLWASLKMVWNAGCFYLLNAWYQVCNTTQKVWTSAVYGLAEIFIKAFYGVQMFWGNFVTGIADVWGKCCNFVAGLWDATMKAVEKCVAKAYGFVTGQTEAETQQVLDDIEKKYNQRAEERQQKFDAASQMRNQNNDERQKQLYDESQDIVNTLNEDEDRKQDALKNEFEQNQTDNAADFVAAKKAYEEAMNKAQLIKPEEGKKPGKLGGRDSTFGGLGDWASLVNGLAFNQPQLPQLNNAMNGAGDSMNTALDSGSSQKKGSFRADELGSGQMAWVRRISEDQLQVVKDIKDLLTEQGEYI